MNLKVLFTDNKLKVAFTLFLVWILAAWHFRTINTFVYPLLAVVLVTLFDVGFTYVRNRKFYLPSASLVTGFLIGLIIDPSGPIWIILAACAVASLSKQFVRAGPRQHIFNPASLGIVTVSLAFGVPVAWWSVAWGYLPLLILIPLLVRILWHMKRLYLPLGFLLIYFIYLAITSSAQVALQVITSGSVILFAFVMVPEPITSPAKGHFKYLFGVLVALAVVLISAFKFGGDIFLPALLVANLVGFLLIKWRFVK